MKAEVNLADLARVVNAVKGMLNRPSVPILGCVVLEVTGDRLTVTATNFELWVRVKLSGGMADGRVAVSGKRLADTLKTLTPKGKAAKTAVVQLVSPGAASLSVSVNNGPTVQLSTGPIEDYPNFPVGVHGALFTVTADEVTAVIDQVLPAVGTDMTIPMLTYVQLVRTAFDGQTYAYATDKYRLHRRAITATARGPVSLLVSSDALNVWKALTKGVACGVVQFETADTHTTNDMMRNEDESVIVMWRNYPDYPKHLATLYPSNPKCVGVFNRDDLLAAVKSTMPLTPRATPIVVRIQPDGVELVVRDDDGKPVFATTVYAQMGQDFQGATIGFYPKQFAEVLAALPAGEPVVWSQEQLMKPGVFQAGPCDHLMMPVRLGN